MKRVEEMIREIESKSHRTLELATSSVKKNVDFFSANSASSDVYLTDASSVIGVIPAPDKIGCRQESLVPSMIKAVITPHEAENLELWKHRSEIQEVSPGLCITNFFGSRNLSSLKANNTTHIVVCANELPVLFPKEFEYLKLEGLTDNTTTILNVHLDRALPWIDRALKNKGRVLLHCAAGSSRSGAILVGYLMWSQHLSLSAALALATNARPIISPNPGFLEQLRNFGSSASL